MFTWSFSLSKSLTHKLLILFFRMILKEPEKHVFLTTTRNVFTKISFPSKVSSEKLMLWRPISRGSTVKVTSWLEEPSTVWDTHLEALLPWWSVTRLPDEQIPSTGSILTQNWNITNEQLHQKHFMIRKVYFDCVHLDTNSPLILLQC